MLEKKIVFDLKTKNIPFFSEANRQVSLTAQAMIDEIVAGYAAAASRLHQAGIEHAIEHMRTPRDDLGQARCWRHDVDDQVEQRRIAGQQRKQLDAGRQAGNEAVEA